MDDSRDDDNKVDEDEVDEDAKDDHQNRYDEFHEGDDGGGTAQRLWCV